jgi:indolepyruvate ferredoxin oxidoreductase, beta subunit
LTSAWEKARKRPPKTKVHRVFDESLADARMQNVAVLARICREGLVPGIDVQHFEEALKDLLKGETLATNLQIFTKALKS